MENATHALIMAASVLIALLVISLGVHIIRTASTVGENYELRVADIENQKFNEKFYKYAKNPIYIKSDTANLDDGHIKTLKTNNPGTDTSYKFADYNTIADVVSAVNQAYNLNKALNYDTVDGVDILINVGSTKYGIVPNKEIKAGYVYQVDNITLTESNHKIGSRIHYNKEKSLNDFLKDYSKTKLENGERYYYYGFKGAVYQNLDTNQVDCIEFTLVQNLAYGNDI